MATLLKYPLLILRTTPLIKMLVIEFIAVWFIAGFVGNILKITGLGKLSGFGASGGDFIYEFVFLAFGMAALIWLVIQILRPVLKNETQVRVMMLDAIFFPDWRIPQITTDRSRSWEIRDFPTTHPSYILIDMITVGLAFTFFAIGSTQNGHSFTQGDPFLIGRDFTLLVVAIGLPIFRLICWYGLGIRPRQAGNFSWQPVIALWVLLVILALVVIVLVKLAVK